MFNLTAVAHRGYSAAFPENSGISYEAAIAAGSPFVETDARLTKDGQVVSVHDPDLKRLAGRDDEVRKTDSKEIRRLDLGRGASPAFLSEVLEIARGRAGVLIDIKTGDVETSRAVLDVVAKAGANHMIYVGLREIEQMLYMKARAMNLHYVGLVRDYSLIPNWRKLGVDVVRIWEEDLPQPQVRAALDGKNPVWVTAGLRRKGETTGHTTEPRLKAIEKTGAEAVLLNDPTLITGKSVDL